MCFTRKISKGELHPSKLFFDHLVQILASFHVKHVHFFWSNDTIIKLWIKKCYKIFKLKKMLNIKNL